MAQTASSGLVVTPAGSAVVTLSDPDGTGYPFINNWKDGLQRDVTVFLRNDERQALTQARIDQSAALQPAFLEYSNAMRGILEPNQVTKFEAMVAYHQDMEKMAAMTDMETMSYLAMLSATLHLNGTQADQTRGILARLMSKTAPIHTAYAASFDTQIAAAEARLALERQNGTWISVPAEVK